MSSWGSWLAGVATTAVGEVKQFGKDYLDSVTAIDEVDENGNPIDQDAPPPQATSSGTSAEQSEEPGESNRAIPVDSRAGGQAEPTVVAPQSPVTSDAGKKRKKGLGAAKVSDTAPSKPGSSGSQTPPPPAAMPSDAKTEKNEAKPKEKGSDGWGIGFGLSLVEKGADYALKFLPDLDAETPDKTSSPTTKSKASVADRAPQEIDPLDLLRSCRGRVELDRREGTAPEPNKEIVEALQAIVDPTTLAEFDYDPSMLNELEWVAKCGVGRRIHTTRVMTTTMEDEDGEKLPAEKILEKMHTFPITATECCNSIARIVTEELADVYAKNITSDCDWFIHEETGSSSGGGVMEQATKRAKNTMALVTYAQCEMAEGAKVLSDLCQECFLWAKKSNLPNVKDVKEKSLSVRGECYVANTGSVTQLEEALECVVVLFPIRAVQAASPSPKKQPDVDVAESPKVAAEPVEQPAPAPEASTKPSASPQREVADEETSGVEEEIKEVVQEAVVEAEAPPPSIIETPSQSTQEDAPPKIDEAPAPAPEADGIPKSDTQPTDSPAEAAVDDEDGRTTPTDEQAGEKKKGGKRRRGKKSAK